MTAKAAERQLIFDVEGMTCASCCTHIERILQRQDGVVEARVSLATRTAAVRCTTADAGRLAAAVEAAGYTARPHKAVTAPTDETKPLLVRLAVSAFLSFDVVVFSLVVAPGSRSSAVAAWLLATPVQFYGGWPFLRNAWRTVHTRAFTMDTLVAVGSSAAYLYSTATLLTGNRHPFFDTASMIVTLVLLGRVLESKARTKAGDAVGTLLRRMPRSARRITDDGEVIVSLDELRIGDRIAVLPGEIVPADGVVRAGESALDLSMLTGESMPVDVADGDEVTGGALNGHGRIEVEVVGLGEDTRVAGIARLLAATQASKAPVQRLADRVAEAFVPRVIWLATAVLFVDWFFGTHGAGNALLRASAVLLVACPCSLGLATPIAIMTGSGRAAQIGILFKNGEGFEVARRIDTVLIDKTGTLTHGVMRLGSAVGASVSEGDLLALAAAVERGSEHPIARAVVEAATHRGLTLPDATAYAVTPGAGVSAVVGGRTIRVGRPRELPPSLVAVADGIAASGETVFAVWRDEEPIGLLSVVDSIREEAGELVSTLRRWGMDVAIVSGDQRPTVSAVAAAIGIDRADAEMFPEGKVEEVRRLQAEGRRVAFVGDGINDAPALAQADLGIALGTGTDVAQEAGRVLILGTDLRRVADCFELARRTFWIIAQNLGWAFAYNILMIPLAAVGKISPLTAAAAMSGSSVTVVVNALRLRGVGSLTSADSSPPRAGETKEVELSRPVPIVAIAPPVGVERREDDVPDGPSAEALPLGVFARQEAGRLAHILSGLLGRAWDY